MFEHIFQYLVFSLSEMIGKTLREAGGGHVLVRLDFQKNSERMCAPISAVRDTGAEHSLPEPFSSYRVKKGKFLISIQV
jgi:hypothetical protein